MRGWLFRLFPFALVFALLGSFVPSAHAVTRARSPLPAALAAATAATPRAAATSPIAADDDGSTYLLWQDTRSPSGMGLFAQKFDGAGQPQWTEGGVAVSLAYGYEQQWQALPDGAGGMFVVWEDDRTYDMSDGNIYLQRVNAAGVPQYATNGVAVCEASGGQGSPVVISDGAGGVIVAWEDARAGFATNIYAQRLDGAGVAQWTADGVVVCNAADVQRSPVVVADGAGGAFLSWIDTRAGEEDGNVYVQRLGADGAAAWTANGVLATDRTGDQGSATLASDGVGGVIVAWADMTPEFEVDLYAQRFGPTGNLRWGAGGVPLCSATGQQWWPRAIEDGEGGAIVAWQDGRGGNDDVYAQRVDSTGAVSWTADGVALCVNGYDQTWTTLASDGAHGAIVAWRDALPAYRAEIHAQRVDSAGTVRWTANGEPVCTVESSKALLAVAADGSGGAVLSWIDTRNRLVTDLYAQRLDSGGAALWTAGGAVVQSATQQVAPVVTATGAGSTITVWMERRQGSYDLRARKLDSAGNALWSGVGVCEAVDLQQGAVATSDGAGGVIVAWMDWRNLTNEPDLYAQRITSDGEAAWMANGVPVCALAGSQYFPVIGSDGAGGAIIVWQDERSGTSDVYAQRLDGSGVAQWTANGIAVCDAALSQQYPVVLSDGAGGAIVAWQESPGEGGGTVSAQRIDGAGARQWAADGVLLVTGFTAASRPMLCTDGAGGAIVSWLDSRSGLSNVYVQRVRPEGLLAWNTAGVRLAASAPAQEAQSIVPAGAGGAIVLWQDTRAVSDYDIYAQSVDSAGAVQWNAAGVAVCAMNDHQVWPVAVTDGLGGVIATWSDARQGSNFDVYAQRVNSLGQRRWGSTDMPVSNGAGNQQGPAIAADGSGGAVIAWEDGRTNGLPALYAQRHDVNGAAQWTGGGVVPAWISLSRMVATPECARLEWYAANAASLMATVYRREGDGEWRVLATLAGDGGGLFVYDDRAIVPGGHYGYRLGVTEAGGERLTSETLVDVPLRARLALAGAWPNPSPGDLRVAFSLRGGMPARLELLDVSGRRVRAWDVSGDGAGSHVRTLDSARAPAPGVYLLRLTEGEARLQRRVTIVR